jgi:endogenous inhibitor of DNA gyrase (YacG/DUF329 family)
MPEYNPMESFDGNKACDKWGTSGWFKWRACPQCDNQVGAYALNVVVSKLGMGIKRGTFGYISDTTVEFDDDTQRVECASCGKQSDWADWDQTPKSKHYMPSEGDRVGFIQEVDDGVYSTKFICMVYEAVSRKKDGLMTWRRRSDHISDNPEGRGIQHLKRGCIDSGVRVVNHHVLGLEPGDKIRHGDVVNDRKEIGRQMLRSL